jgi:hypothetical protein
MLTSAVCKATPISTSNILAGSDIADDSGFSNGTGSAAKFNQPRNMVYDGSHNLYVSDTANHAIRKITPAGVVTTYAGTGSPGSTNANGTSASFSTPSGLAIDASSNVYVADSGNNVIRKIDTSQNVTTFALSLTGPSEVAVSSNASTVIAVDTSQNIYVYLSGADQGRINPGFGYPAVTSVACRPDDVFYYTPADVAGQPGIIRLTFGSTLGISRNITSSTPGTKSGGFTPVVFALDGVGVYDPFAVGKSVTISNISAYNGAYIITAYNTSTFTVSIFGTFPGGTTYYDADPPRPGASVYIQNPTHDTVTVDGSSTSANYYTQLSFQSTSNLCAQKNSGDFVQFNLTGDAATSNVSVEPSTNPPNFAVKSSTPFEFSFAGTGGDNSVKIYNKKY